MFTPKPCAHTFMLKSCSLHAIAVLIFNQTEILHFHAVLCVQGTPGHLHNPGMEIVVFDLKFPMIFLLAV